MINNTTVENKHTTTDTLDTVYPITFEGATDAGGYPLLKVTITDTEGAVQNLVYNIDYVLVYDDNQEGNDESLNEPHLNGIKLIRAELAIAGNSLTITRNTPFVQPIDFQVGRIDPEQVERVADLSVLRDQELRNQMVKDETVIEDHENRISAAEETIDNHEERITTAEGTIDNHERRLTTAEGDIDTIEATLSGHLNNLNNPHQTSISNLTDTNITSPANGQFMMFDGLKWKNVSSTVAMFWGDMQGDISDQTDLVAEFAKKVNKSGDTMTGDLSFQYNANNPVLRIIQSGQNTNHLRFINNNSASQSISFDLTQAAIHPLVTGRGHLGTSSIHFGDAYIDKIYTGVINNGYDISVPVTAGADSFALESEITDINGKIPAQASTTNQLADKNFVNSSIATNTADFKGTYNSLADLEAVTADNNDYGFVVSTDSAGNTVYARYKYNGTSWVFEYNLNNSSFTAAQWATINSGATASDVSKARTAVQPADVGNGTITINQGGATKGTFTTNQSGNTTIDLDAGSDGSYHPEILSHEWDDHIRDDVQWLRADTFSWQSGEVYQAAYQHLLYDIYHIQRTRVYMWQRSINGHVFYVFTLSATPQVDDTAYIRKNDGTNLFYEPDQAITAVPDSTHIKCGGYTYGYADLSVDGVVAQKETIAGTDIIYYVSTDGHKICWDVQESNVDAIYNATGVAWYYVLDKENQRFKLPRAKHNKYMNTLSVVGNGSSIYVRSSGGTVGDTRIAGWKQPSSAGYKYLTTETSSETAARNSETVLLSTDPTKSGMIAQQEQDTDQYKYLYFYVGQFTQTALENTAGINASLFNNKADVDLGNVSSAGKARAVNWFMPDTTAGINIGSYATYTFGSDGWLVITTGSAGSVQYTSGLYVADTYSPFIYGCLNPNGAASSNFYPVQKGETVTKTYSAGNWKAMFYPIKGAQ